MTETKNNGKLFYDATCRFCTEGAMTLRPWLAKKNVVTVPFENGAEEAEMKLAWHDGRVFGGAEAAIFLARQFWLTWPLALISMLPGFRQLTHAGYRWVARNRRCLNGACEIDLSEPKPPKRWIGWTLLTGLAAVAVAAGLLFPIAAWIWMWMLAGALWVGFKFMAFQHAGGLKKVIPLYFLWVGTDTRAFLWNRDRTQPARRGSLLVPFGFVIVGLVLILFALPAVENVIVTGWIGVAAMLCLLHFGGFAVLAELWNRIGFPVEPIMQKPWAAKTLSDFWGPRWNRAFSDWARTHVFRPWVYKLGVVRGTLAGFLASGLAHELVVSLPARGGFGLPTLYFLIQAAGLLAQRRLGFLNNRVITLALVLLPAPILFHPLFIERVFAPMMNLITPGL